ncbi:MAG: hypothetical protein IJ537_02110 [Bacteroidaceae bacterium]|nr:hypothetical protein [Bacteroidaceae bacterium]
MAIRFTVAKRRILPEERPAEEGVVAGLQPRAEHQPTVDVVAFQNEGHWGSLLRGSDIAHALSEVRRIMMHEMEDGKPVRLPGIGTFRLSLKGKIEMNAGNYHGRDVRVDNIIFQPDREWRREVQRFQVEQVPSCGPAFTDSDEVGQRLAELFAQQDTITHKDVVFAFGQVLSKHRATSLLQRLTADGSLIREGTGSQTRYRPAPGCFGR